MLVVVASAQDQLARTLVRQWHRHGAAQLTPRDLATAGWQVTPEQPGTGQAVVSGKVVAMQSITGVLTRLPWITPADLPFIAPGDRVYVAAEMNAFLLSWLTYLPVPVVNRPTPSCLAGPDRPPAAWVHLATRLGVPTQPCCLATASDQVEPANDQTTVAVVGGQCAGPVDATRGGWARQIAAAVGASLLSVHFCDVDGRPCLVGADPWPDIRDPVRSDAVLGLLHEPVRNVPGGDDDFAVGDGDRFTLGARL